MTLGIIARTLQLGGLPYFLCLWANKAIENYCMKYNKVLYISEINKDKDTFPL